jgi:hypothetical protein
MAISNSSPQNVNGSYNMNFSVLTQKQKANLQNKLGELYLLLFYSMFCSTAVLFATSTWSSSSCSNHQLESLNSSCQLFNCQLQYWNSNCQHLTTSWRASTAAVNSVTTSWRASTAAVNALTDGWKHSTAAVNTLTAGWKGQQQLLALQLWLE